MIAVTSPSDSPSSGMIVFGLCSRGFWIWARTQSSLRSEICLFDRFAECVSGTSLVDCRQEFGFLAWLNRTFAVEFEQLAFGVIAHNRVEP